MRKWKKFMAIGLAASMMTPSCVPQILWASEFSSGSGESVQNTFDDGLGADGTDIETGNKTSDRNVRKYEFETGETESYESTENITDGGNGKKGTSSSDADNRNLEQSETEKGVNAGQVIEGYTIQLCSDGKIEKTYVIPYGEVETAKAPEALNGNKGYVFKEWNTKEDGSGEAYKSGDSISAFLQTVANKTTQNENPIEQEVKESIESQYSEINAELSTDDTAVEKTEETDETITLYAIWEKATEYKITYKLNKGKNNGSNPKTYTEEDEIKLQNPTRSGYHFVGWYTDSKYKQKTDMIEKGTTGTIILYAKWIKEINPSAKAASLTSVKGAKAKTITATVVIPDYVKSTDDYYYLIYVDSNTGKAKKEVAQVKKPETQNGKVTFKLDISGHPEYAQGKFAVAVKKSKTAYTVISSGSYVSNPEKLSSNTAAYYVPKTKKGIQSTSINEVKETKSKTVFINLFASDIMRSGYGSEAYQYNGKTYYFNGLYNFRSFVQQCNVNGIQVTAQISLDKTADTQSVITGNSPYSETAYYGWNTNSSAARQKMEATFAYLGEIFGSDNCYISNWILGNEINSASHYYYVGNVSFSKYISMYSEAFRCLYNAVRSSRGSSKVFTCLDNCWNQKNIFTVCYTSKSTLDCFAKNISRLQKDVNWNLAYHAYSQPLTEAKFWSSVNAPLLKNDGNTATFITMHNIQALTDYVKNKFGSKTRVILSEQGFSSSFGGQASQAASMALAYYKAACNPMIDAFIIRSYRDESHEIAQGLALGLKDTKGKKKTVYSVFQNMDSANSLKYAGNVLKSQVGNWKVQVPGYSAKRVSSMYRK